MGWIEIQSSTMEIDRGFEMLDVAEAPGRFLDPLNGGIEGFHARIRDAMPDIGQHVGEVAPNQLGDRRHRRQATVGGAPEPAGKEGLRGAAIGIVPELAEALLERPGPCHFEVRVLHGAEEGALFGRHVRGPHEPEILCAGQTRVINLLQHAMLRAADPIHSVMQVLGHMELIEDNLAIGLCQVSARRLNVRLPHVHGDRLDAVLLFGCQGGPEPIQTLLRPILGQIEHAALRQICHHGEVPVPLRDGLLIDTEMLDDLLGASMQPASDRPCLDPPGFVPRETQQSGSPLHRALPKQVDGQALEPGGELAARLSPGDCDLFDPMHRTPHARHLGLNPGRKLAGVQVSPSAVFPIVAWDRLLALGTQIWPWSRVDGDGHLLPRHIQLHVDDSPRSLQAQDGLRAPLITAF